MAVKFGIQISFTHRPDEIIAQAVRAEEAGFSSLWLGEHIFTPVNLESIYPYTKHRPLQTQEECSDSMITAGAIANATRRIEITSGIYLLPLRHPLMAARAMTTLHRLANGRVKFGLGAGWAKEEYDALGIPFAERGSRLNEGIEVLRKAFAGGQFEHHGRHYDFDPLIVLNQPLPLTLLVGGSTDAALKRAAKYADGWCATPDLTLEQCMQKRDLLEAMRNEFGRANAPFTVHVRMPQATSELVARYADAGFTSITIGGGQVVKWADPLERKTAYITEIARTLKIGS